MYFLKKNYVIKKSFIPKKNLLNFEKELTSIINQIIRINKLPISNKCSLDLKLMCLEEINHKYISLIYSKIKDTNFFRELFRNKSLKIFLKKTFKKKIEVNTKAVRFDLPNNHKWNLTWHQEYSYNDESNKKKDYLIMWFPLLNPNNQYSGGLEILDRFTDKHYDFRIIKKKNSQIQREPKKIIKKKDKDIKHIMLKLGDVLIFDKYLFHRSVANISHKVKLTGVVSFIGD